MEGRHDRHVIGAGPVDIELRHVLLGRVDIGLLRTNVTLVVEQKRRTSDAYLVQFPLSGSFDLEIDGREFSIQTGSAAVISPLQRVRRSGHPGRTLVFRLPVDLVRSHVEARTGRVRRSPLVFHTRIGDAAELLSYALLVVEAIDRGAAKSGNDVAAVLEEGFTSLLLGLQPHNQSGMLFRSRMTSRWGRMQAVVEHIDAHLGRRLTVAQLARVARCSVRSLQSMFIEFFGMSPMEYVRGRRLSLARNLLQQASPGVGVSEIGNRVGLTHGPRFAAMYRARYGESPSATFRHARATNRRHRG
jgi:AraC-like DNA-binding protein